MPKLGKFKSKYKRRNCPIYTVWGGMHRRCGNKSCKDYRYYGGRGISICKDWYCFDKFFEDMGPSYIEGNTLDRINNDGNYEPSNCRWVTRKIQCNNRSNNNWIKDPETGEIKTLTQWCELFGLKERTISSRFNILKIREFSLLFSKEKLPRGTKYKFDYDANEIRRVVD